MNKQNTTKAEQKDTENPYSVPTVAEQNDMIQQILEKHKTPLEIKFTKSKGSFFNVFSKSVAIIEMKDATCKNIIINANLYVHARLLDQDQWSITTDLSLLKVGRLGSFSGANVLVNRNCPKDEVLLVGETNSGLTITARIKTEEISDKISYNLDDYDDQNSAEQACLFIDANP